MLHLLLAAVVLINDFKFQPSTITVSAGDTIRFENKDQEAHTVASTGEKMLNSPGIDTNGTWSLRLTKPGTYHYICGLHPFMTGTIVVVPAKGQKK